MDNLIYISVFILIVYNTYHRYQIYNMKKRNQKLIDRINRLEKKYEDDGYEAY